MSPAPTAATEQSGPPTAAAEQTAPPGLATERAALANELHDLVTHQVTVVAVQLAAAQTLPPQPGGDDYAPLAAALSTLDALRQDLRRLGRLLARDHRAAPLEPIPSAGALAARLAGGPEDPALPAGVVVCAYRCLELLRPARTTATVAAGELLLDVALADERDREPGDQDLAPRIRLRLEPCDGRLRIVTPTHWRLELPLRA